MVSLGDILTAIKNLVTAMGAATVTLQIGQGQSTSDTVTAATLITTGPGRLVNYAVLVAGAAGTVYDSDTVAGVAAVNALIVVPATVGVAQIGQVFTAGLVVVPGAGQSVNVTYSKAI